MTQDDILRMAREAGLYEDGKFFVLLPRELIHFYTLAAAAEREACAKVADLVAREIDDTNGTATYIAAAIRTRSKT
jgi:hypothetical protein